MHSETKQALIRQVNRNVTNIGLSARAETALRAFFAAAEKNLSQLKRCNFATAHEVSRLAEALAVIGRRPVADKDIAFIRYIDACQNPALYLRGAACVEPDSRLSARLERRAWRLMERIAKPALSLGLQEQARAAVDEAYAAQASSVPWAAAQKTTTYQVLVLLLASAIGNRPDLFEAARVLLDLSPNFLVVGKHHREDVWVALAV